MLLSKVELYLAEPALVTKALEGRDSSATTVGGLGGCMSE